MHAADGSTVHTRMVKHVLCSEGTLLGKQYEWYGMPAMLGLVWSFD